MAELLPYGDVAVLVASPAEATPAQVAEGVRALGLVGVVDVVPAAATVLVTFADAGSRAAAQSLLARVVPAPAAAFTDEVVIVPTRYDGADLAEVARLTGLTPADVVRRHTEATWRVAFVGFAPGFAYVGGDDPALTVPRRSSPRASVPAGSVALADGFSGISPRASPGGWQLIGTTDLPVWDLTRRPPALLRAGVRVQFVEVTS